MLHNLVLFRIEKSIFHLLIWYCNGIDNLVKYGINQLIFQKKLKKVEK